MINAEQKFIADHADSTDPYKIGILVSRKSLRTGRDMPLKKSRSRRVKTTLKEKIITAPFVLALWIMYGIVMAIQVVCNVFQTDRSI